MSSKLSDKLKQFIFEDSKRQPFDIQPPAHFGSKKIHENYVFAEPTEENSILIDVSQLKNSFSFEGRTVGKQLREEYPGAIGIKFGTTSGYHLNNQVYVEVIFETESESEEALLKQYLSLVYNDERHKFCVTCYVFKPLPKNSKVIHIDISGIPLQKTADVRDLLMNMFSKHGEVLKMGIYVSVGGKWFNGEGYITLITHKSEDKYEVLLKPQVVYGCVTYSTKSYLLNWNIN